MPNRRLTVSVPQPCHQDWHAMSPELQGRFCQNCAKTVVDFTAMSDAEVVNWLTKQEGRTCGRLSEKQLGRELVATAPRNRWTWRAAVLGLSVWLSTKTVEAHPSPAFPLSIRDAAPKSEIPQKAFAADSLVVLKGRILDATTNTPMPGTTVLLKGTTVSTPTDVNGYFSLGLPIGIQPEEQTVIFSFIGYQTQERKVAELLRTSEVTILLSQDTSFMGETVIVGGAFWYKWYSPRGLYYRVKNLFR
ncbi:carboxypeptidase-like regulatory domain-containing protein [Rufibacter hautae]|uniref:Carboxypeptidase-like regulatory domain-containing protein n=1 Tax=Rufibacter hautae TaxID=2595005 RepID=A0A5B6TLE8_9BACT|nr:carboxypeptidase-like regulatory domain-containing protein [Rufibacter hautae]KAA3440259.1 carboxypeptidase-like regulatory domain-containing protein [Rufibacter hautae]